MEIEKKNVVKMLKYSLYVCIYPEIRYRFKKKKFTYIKAYFDYQPKAFSQISGERKQVSN